MKQIIFLLLILTGLSACFTPRRCNEIVRKRYSTVDTTHSRTTGGITITHAIEGVSGALSSSAKTKSKLIPALIYWHWETILGCGLNPGIPVHTFAGRLQLLSDSLGLSKTLAGRRLEIEVTSIPDRFMYKDKGDAVFLIFAVASKERQGCYSEMAPLTIQYKLYENSSVVKQGSVTVPDNEISVVNNMKTPGGCTKVYLKKYDAHLEFLTNRLYDKLVKEITM